MSEAPLIHLCNQQHHLSPEQILMERLTIWSVYDKF